MVREHYKIASWYSLTRSVSGISHWMETLAWSKDQLEILYLTVGLGASKDPQESSRICGWG